MNNEELNFNDIKLSGKINNIIERDNYTIFGMTCESFSTTKSKTFASLRIYKDLYYKYKDLFFKENKLFIKGYLNSYSDSNNNICNYIMVTKVSDNYKELESAMPHIRYDEDGVMVWDGKRCESKECSEEEIKELEDMLSEFR